jgi:hypothetical protein
MGSATVENQVFSENFHAKTELEFINLEIIGNDGLLKGRRAKFHKTPILRPQPGQAKQRTCSGGTSTCANLLYQNYNSLKLFSFVSRIVLPGKL